MKEGRYYVEERQGAWRVVRCVSSFASATTTELVAGEQPYGTLSAAKKRVYELNGWHFAGRKKKHT